jgi:hypothetical protein
MGHTHPVVSPSSLFPRGECKFLRPGFRGTLFAALKGASGPREGQKSTFSSHNPISELTFCPQYADLGI